jgi:predicted DNA-binding transcriptional regulator AlpA
MSAVADGLVDPLIAPPALAAELGVPESTLAQWRYLGRGPRYLKIGRHVRYRRSDITAWIETKVAESK